MELRDEDLHSVGSNTEELRDEDLHSVGSNTDTEVSSISRTVSFFFF